ncbi:MAG: hypothetical protein JXR16_05090 [Bermanella sp.]|jgi:hypothetical protein
MAKPQDESQPKYMHIEGKTQYEMAQSIDAAFAAAEASIDHQSEEVALQWWYQQFELQIQEELNLAESRLPSGNVTSEGTFLQLSKMLIQRVLDMQVDHRHKISASITINLLLERSLLDAIDMMQAKQIWRFDLQRKLQTLQGRLINERQSPTTSS